jgi:hypothetical protein
LNPQHQADVLSTNSAILRSALLAKNTNLRQNELFGELIIHLDCGYHILYELARLSGHPQLLPHRTPATEPRQRDSETLSEYMLNWMHFLYLGILDGIHYSDRYFLQQFCAGLAPSLYFLNDFIYRTLSPWMSETRIHQPVPSLLRPQSLISTLHAQATHQHKSQHALKSPMDVHAARRSTNLNALGQQQNRYGRSPQTLLHELQQDAGYEEETTETTISDSLIVDDGPLSEDELHDWRVMALTHRPRGCFWCNKDDHMLLKCPHAQKVFGDPRARRAVRGFLQDSASRPVDSKVHLVTTDESDATPSDS